VPLAGHLPFEDDNIASLYNKISGAQFTCPSWFSAGAKRLVTRILDPNPSTVSHYERVNKNDFHEAQVMSLYCMSFNIKLLNTFMI